MKLGDLTKYTTPMGTNGDLTNPVGIAKLVTGTVVFLVAWDWGQKVFNKISGRTNLVGQPSMPFKRRSQPSPVARQNVRL